MLLVFTTSIPSLVFAESNKDAMPKNAHAKTYGNGWECDLGFQAVGKICITINSCFGVDF